MEFYQNSKAASRARFAISWGSVAQDENLRRPAGGAIELLQRSIAPGVSQDALL